MLTQGHLTRSGFTEDRPCARCHFAPRASLGPVSLYLRCPCGTDLRVMLVCVSAFVLLACTGGVRESVCSGHPCWGHGKSSTCCPMGATLGVAQHQAKNALGCRSPQNVPAGRPQGHPKMQLHLMVSQKAVVLCYIKGSFGVLWSSCVGGTPFVFELSSNATLHFSLAALDQTFLSLLQVDKACLEDLLLPHCSGWLATPFVQLFRRLREGGVLPCHPEEAQSLAAALEHM